MDESDIDISDVLSPQEDSPTHLADNFSPNNPSHDNDPDDMNIDDFFEQYTDQSYSHNHSHRQGHQQGNKRKRKRPNSIQTPNKNKSNNINFDNINNINGQQYPYVLDDFSSGVTPQKRHTKKSKGRKARIVSSPSRRRRSKNTKKPRSAPSSKLQQTYGTRISGGNVSINNIHKQRPQSAHPSRSLSRGATDLESLRLESLFGGIGNPQFKGAQGLEQHLSNVSGKRVNQKMSDIYTRNYQPNQWFDKKLLKSMDDYKEENYNLRQSMKKLKQENLKLKSQVQHHNNDNNKRAKQFEALISMALDTKQLHSKYPNTHLLSQLRHEQSINKGLQEKVSHLHIQLKNAKREKETLTVS